MRSKGRATSCLALLALGIAACSATPDTTAAGAPAIESSDQTPPRIAATPVAPAVPSPPASTPDPHEPADVPQDAAVAFMPRSPGTGQPTKAAPAAAAGVDYADPLAAARAYVTTRLTYRFDNPAGYTAALTAPSLTTRGFAARSKPSASALARLATAQETSAVRVGRAQLEGEAPNSRRTRYVVVACTVTTTYRGGSDTAPARWTVRLLQGRDGRWRVDGVLSTD